MRSWFIVQKVLILWNSRKTKTKVFFFFFLRRKPKVLWTTITEIFGKNKIL